MRSSIPASRTGERPPRGRLLRWLRRDLRLAAGAGLVTLFACATAAAAYLAPADPTVMHLDRALLPPSRQYLLGTDQLGRDLLSRVLHAGRTSMTIGLISVGVSVVLGVPVGLVAGYYGGWTDLLTMRGIDILQAFPALLLAIMVIAVLGPGLQHAMLAIGIAAAPLFTRLMRGSVLVIAQAEFVHAARALGNTDARILARHVFPGAVAPLIVQASLRMGTAILTSASLSFLGLGVQPPMPEWGAMVSEARLLIRTHPHVLIFPGLAIMLCVLGFNLLGDGLSEYLDPRLRC